MIFLTSGGPERDFDVTHPLENFLEGSMNELMRFVIPQCIYSLSLI